LYKLRVNNFEVCQIRAELRYLCGDRSLVVSGRGGLDVPPEIRNRREAVAESAPIQLAIRLLIPAGSKLLELDDLETEAFDPAALSWRWKHPDPEMDILCADLQRIVRVADKKGLSRAEVFREIWQRAYGDLPDFHLVSRSAIPYLTEPWYC
jgi:hypothetical protein